MNTHGLPRLLAMAILLPALAAAQGDSQSLARDVEALKSGQEAMRRELQEIKRLLQGMQPPTAQAAPRAGAEPVDLTVRVAGSPFRGDKAAKVTLVEFTDYQCPFCARYYRGAWPQIEQEYVKTGKVKVVLRDNPLESIHPLAFKAAEATHCAGQQGRFWEMHGRIFANIAAIRREDLAAHAQALGLDGPDFARCLDTGQGAARIRADISDAASAGAAGTPTFFVALTEPDERPVKALRVVRGAHPFPAFKEAIDAVLATAK